MFQKLTTIDLFSLSVNSVRGSESCLTLGVQYMNNMFFDSKVMVFCYIICPNSKTFLLVLLRFWVVQALERLPTWKFDLRDLFEVSQVNLPRLAASRGPGQPKIEARPPKRSRCMGI